MQATSSVKDRSFTVVFRTGGPAAPKWNRSVAFATREEAATVAARVERMGYKALVHRTYDVDTIGLPEGWEFEPSHGARVEG